MGNPIQRPAPARLAHTRVAFRCPALHPSAMRCAVHNGRLPTPAHKSARKSADKSAKKPACKPWHGPANLPS